MIAALRGKLRARTGNSLVIDVNGVGYLVQVSARTLEHAGIVNAEVDLLIITQVREDAITLFGFSQPEERDVFTLLTSVQGVGARIALSILSMQSPAEVLAALVQENRAALTAADGVGPKLAARMVTELRDKAANLSQILGMAPQGTSDVVVLRGVAGVQDAELALVQLGYGKSEVKSLLATVMAQQPPPEGATAIIRACLKSAGSRM